MSHYVTKPDGYREPTIGSSGYAARPPKTVPQVFRETSESFPENKAMGVKRVAKGVSYRIFILDTFCVHKIEVVDWSQAP